VAPHCLACCLLSIVHVIKPVTGGMTVFAKLRLLQQSNAGDQKVMLSLVTGLWPSEQRLLFKGKEIDNCEHLHMVGVQDNDKVLLLEDLAVKERKLRSTPWPLLMKGDYIRVGSNCMPDQEGRHLFPVGRHLLSACPFVFSHVAWWIRTRKMPQQKDFRDPNPHRLAVAAMHRRPTQARRRRACRRPSRARFRRACRHPTQARRCSPRRHPT